MSDNQPSDTLNTDGSLPGTAPPFVPPLSLPADASAGLDLRGYELIETLGQGGMGEVHRCADPALGRDLAIKVMQTAYGGIAEVERRFVREAHITGSLQHPGIVPIHNLGRLADGRLHYTMRLVRGRTFSEILKEEAGKPERWPELLTVFLKICQAVAYAHSKRVIHRDLKPANVMVGKFGEVQVMDWGLAKLLPEGERDCVSASSAEEDAGTRIARELGSGSAHLTRAGSGMGTPAHMPPEQALGEWDAVDERADVFALGSILCQMLTGLPAYSGRDGEEVFRRAKRGDTAEALQRLARCGADRALTELCRECLSAEREDRPRDAGAVAQRVADHQTEVQERLRQAELQRVAAEAGAREALGRMTAERRAKRMLLGLAAAVLLFVLLGVVGLAAAMLSVRAEQRRTQDEQVHTQEALVQAMDEQLKTQKALKAERAARMQTRTALNTLTDDVMKDLLAKQAGLSDKEKLFLRKVLGFYEQFAAERGEEEEARAVAAEGRFGVARLRYFLDEYTEAEKDFRIAVGLYEKLVKDFPTETQYRFELARSQADLGRLLQSLNRIAEAEDAFRRAMILLEEWTGESTAALPKIRRSLSVVYQYLGNVIRDRGRSAEAEAFYRQATALLGKLVDEFPGEFLYRRDWAYYHTNWSILLRRLGKPAEAETMVRKGLTILEKLADDFPADPLLRQMLSLGYLELAFGLADVGKRAEEEAAYRQALALRHKLAAEYPAVPMYRRDLAQTHSLLARLFRNQGRFAEAEAEYRQALVVVEKLSRDHPAEPHYRADLAYGNIGLGISLRGRGKPVEAEAAFRTALAILEKLVGEFPALRDYPHELAHTHNNLADLLAGQGRRTEAGAAHRQALALRKKLADDYPDVPEYRQELAGSYVNIGRLFLTQGRPTDALDCYAKAIPLLDAILAANARLVTARLYLRNAHIGRADALGRLDRHTESAKDWQRAIELDDGRSRLLIRLRSAAALARAGEHRAAVKLTAELLDSRNRTAAAPVPAWVLYDAACVYALSAAVAKNDDELREQYAARAATLLRQAQKAGFFKDPKQIANIRKDTDLDALRPRDDFKKFLAELK